MTIIISICVILICVVLLGVKVFFIRGGQFPSMHIHDNKALKKKVFIVPMENQISKNN